VYVSNKRFWKVTHKIYAIGETKSADVNAIILDTYAKMMQRYLLEKDAIPKGQLIEIKYEDYIQRPIESMRKIYETLQLENFDYCEDKMKGFAGVQKNFVRLKHELPEEERKVVSEKLGPFIKHWDYPLL
jgi:hypothetical protein